MRCPACKTKAEASAAECSKCRLDLRWSVQSPDGQLRGPYTLAELQGHAALGEVQPWTWVQSKYGDVIQFRQLEAGIAAASPAAPLPGAPTPGNWARAAGVTAAVGFGVMGLVGMVVWLAVAVPAMNHSQKAASDVGCLKDASLLVEALHKYAADHDGKLPDAQTWREAVKPYLPGDKIPACGEVQAVGAGYELCPDLSGAELWGAEDRPLLWDAGWLSGRPGPHKGCYTVAFTGGATMWLPPEG
ncbi:MAG: hypothetical protein FJX74_01440 [Armatimonadetes bacterium]|nr:hypothetical protein [Armatimonadota bacterium]